ncbi:diflavin flavoprotein [Synechococcus elongatus]|uniref:Diflavin flavoprotein n=1 Tax=Synechococcus elongatus PCC 11801 TaxID=2219813 RepID=A0AAN1QP78_SYNEL|nr:diflavin flavoprotein [Synechococcus elongatus]AZB72983.1 flavin oxidoreductase [Synechococcus elongatus PCC 11801]
MSEGRRRDIQPSWVASGLMVLRARSWERLRFEVEYGLGHGTTSNAYLIQGDRTLLINPPGASFTEIFLASLEAQRPIGELDAVLLSHVNPNRVSTLKELMRLNPGLQVIVSNPAAQALDKLWQVEAQEAPIPPLDLKIVRAEETLDLGRGKVLQLIPTPTPRWPDGLCVFDEQTGWLLSDKFFSAHLCQDALFDEGWTSFREDQRYYFDCVMAPQVRQVQTVLAKFSRLPVQGYAPSHGPLIRYGLHDLTTAYTSWSDRQIQQPQMVALLYASAYGSTATIAEAIAQGITKAGVRVEALNCEVESMDDIRQTLEACDGVVIGSPTLGGHAPTPIQTALGTILATVSRDKPAGVFGSFGWSGEAIDLLENKLKDAGFRLAFEPIRVRFKPTASTLKTCEEAGTDLAQALQRQRRQASRQTSSKLQDSETEATAQAVGRILGSLCVLTTQKEEIRSGMLASWVSQATFNPPGISVAVARDRAVESLLHQGDRFVLNILGENKNVAIQKHFLRPFSPGADRLDGIEFKLSDQGHPILIDAAAWLECRVANRMECGDHWLVYAVVEAGQVQDAEARTAIHHRKSGSHY